MRRLDHKIRVGVLMGGRSIECEVSFNSGRTVCDHLDSDLYEVIPIFQTHNGQLYQLTWKFLHRGKISDFEQRLPTQAQRLTWSQLPQVIDFMYLALHGRYAEDGTVQGILTLLGIPYLGTKIFGSALSMNKAINKQILAQADVIVPKGFVVSGHNVATIDTTMLNLQVQQAGISFPLVVKPSEEGSSLGVSVVHTAPSLLDAVRYAGSVDENHIQSVLVEEKVLGMEFVCVLIQEDATTWKALPITQVVYEAGTEFFDYNQKYMPGRASKITPAHCSAHDQEAIIRACIKTAEALNFATIARIDGIVTHDSRVVILDANTITGMSPATFLFHQAAEAGMSHADLINHLITHELKQTDLKVQLLDAQEQKKKAVMMDHKERLRVAVMLGGSSNEREISLESGRNVCYKLSSFLYDVTPVFVDSSMRLFKLDPRLLIKNSAREIETMVTDEMLLTWDDIHDMFDFVFLGLHGGPGEDGTVQGALEMLGIPYNGSGVLASALCMDKEKANQFLAGCGFHVPPSHVATADEYATIQMHTQHLAFPLIVKPTSDGCSMFVSQADTVDELNVALDHLFAAGIKRALIEEKIVGLELTCGVLGNKHPIALPPSAARAQKGVLSIEEKFLPGSGENITPAPLDDKAMLLVKTTMEQAYQALGCAGYARIDCFYQDELISPTGKPRVVILEVNTLPALTPATCLFHQAAEVGMKPAELLDHIIQLGLEQHQQQGRKMVKLCSKKEQTISLS